MYVFRLRWQGVLGYYKYDMTLGCMTISSSPHIRSYTRPSPCMSLSISSITDTVSTISYCNTLVQYCEMQCASARILPQYSATPSPHRRAIIGQMVPSPDNKQYSLLLIVLYAIWKWGRCGIVQPLLSTPVCVFCLVWDCFCCFAAVSSLPVFHFYR